MPNPRILSDDKIVFDASHIEGLLYIGAAPEFDYPLPIDALALCAREIQPSRDRLIFRGNLIRAYLRDIEPIPEDQIQAAIDAARMVALELKRQQLTLVTCAAGLNRSSLVAALALRILTPQRNPDEIIKLIRTRRSEHALFNEFFVQLVRELPVR